MMTNRKSRILALYLSLTMLAGLCPVTALAEGEEKEIDEDTSEIREEAGLSEEAEKQSHEHRLVFAEAKEPTATEYGNIEYWYCIGCGACFADENGVYSLTGEQVLLFPTGGENGTEVKTEKSENKPLVISASGRCGSNLTWTLDGGVLTISGTGDMYSYDLDSEDYSPWYSSRSLITDVRIGDGVTSVGSTAFSHCSMLTSVTIPDNVTSIGYAAFSGCHSLPSVIIPSSVTSIGNYAFNLCDSLTSITIPDSVTSIGKNAFVNCFRLKNIYVSAENTQYSSINGTLYNKEGTSLLCCPGGQTGQFTIPSGVMTIEEYAFYNCIGLTSVSIPDSVTSIGDYAFAYSAQYAYANSGLTSVTIPDSVTSIGNYAFNLCDSLTSITIPDSVTSIGQYAFASSGLTSVIIPGSVKSIEDSAFRSCRDLTCVTIPDSVTSIGQYAFWGCDSLTDIYYLGTEEAWGEVSLDSSVFPSGATIHVVPAHTHTWTATTYEWGTDFSTCTATRTCTDTDCGEVETADAIITSLVTTEPACSASGVRTYTAAFSVDWANTKNCTESVPARGHDWGEAIYEWSEDYSGCTATRICDTDPSHVETESGTVSSSTAQGIRTYTATFTADWAETQKYEISAVVSGECGANIVWTLYDSGLLSIEGTGDMEKYSSRGAPWYDNRAQITKLEIGNEVTGIGGFAFQECSSMASAVIPDSVTSIGSCAFSFCDSLTSITIPDSVTSIGKNAFVNCLRLKNIYVSAENTQYSSINGTLYNKEGTSLLCCPGGQTGQFTIPSGVMTIEEYAFYNCIGLTSVSIPDSVTSIGNYAFFAAGLTSVSIPDSVTSIGDYAFRHCGHMTSVTIPSSVTSIGAFAFGGCESLSGISLPNSVTDIGEGAFYYCRGLTSVTIPDSLTSIKNNAFNSCDSLTSITIPDSVTDIGNGAFQYCSGLTSVTIPDSVTAICDYTFNGCAGLTSVTIGDSVASIGVYAFGDCVSLTNITIPKSVTTIYSYAFNGCSNLTSINADIENPQFCSIDGTLYNKEETIIVCCPAGKNGHFTIPEGVTGIAQAFSSCSGLTSVTIPGSVTNMFCAFLNCRGLTSVTISDSITSIDSSAFEGCSGLTSVTIPDSVTSIGNYAFKDCSSLTSVSIPESITIIYANAFEGCSGLTDVYYLGTEKEWGDITFDISSFPENAEIHFHTHSWGEIVYEWSEDHSECTATRVCNAGPSHKKTANGVITGIKDGNVTTYTANFPENWAETQTIQVTDPTPPADATLLTLDSVKGKAGQELELFFTLSESVTVKSMAITDLSYDHTALTLAAGEWLLNGTIADVNINDGNAVITFNSNTSVSGAVLKLKFRINDSTEEGDYPVCFNVSAKEKVPSGGESSVDIYAEAGTVTCRNVLPGDLDGDGYVTSDDAIYLLYSTLMPQSYPVNQTADFDGDGYVTSDDAVYLLYYTFMPGQYPLTH